MFNGLQNLRCVCFKLKRHNKFPFFQKLLENVQCCLQIDSGFRYNNGVICVYYLTNVSNTFRQCLILNFYIIAFT